MADTKQPKNVKTTNTDSKEIEKTQNNILSAINEHIKDTNKILSQGMRDMNGKLNYLLAAISGIKAAMLVGSAINAGISYVKNKKIISNISPEELNTDIAVDKFLELEKSSNKFVKNMVAILNKLGDILEIDLSNKFLDPSKQISNYDKLKSKAMDGLTKTGDASFTSTKDILEAITLKSKLGETVKKTGNSSYKKILDEITSYIDTSFVKMMATEELGKKQKKYKLNEYSAILDETYGGMGSSIPGIGLKHIKTESTFGVRDKINIDDILRRSSFINSSNITDSSTYAMASEEKKYLDKASEKLLNKRAEVYKKSLTEDTYDSIVEFENKIRAIQETINKKYSKTQKKQADSIKPKSSNTDSSKPKESNNIGIVANQQIINDLKSLWKYGKTPDQIKETSKYNESKESEIYKARSINRKLTKNDQKEFINKTFNGVRVLNPKEIEKIFIENYKKHLLFPFFGRAEKIVDNILYPSAKTKPINIGNKLNEIFSSIIPKNIGNTFNKIKGKASGLYETITKTDKYEPLNLLDRTLRKMGSVLQGSANYLPKPIQAINSFTGLFNQIGVGILKTLPMILNPIGLAITGFFFVFVFPMFKELKKNMEKWFNYMEALSKSTFLFTKGITNQTKILEANSRTAVKIGLSQTKYVEQVSQIGETLRINGLTTRETLSYSDKILRRAADVGSFSNIDPQKFIDATISAINGERERLKTLGVVINQDSLDQQARQQYNTKNFNSLARVDKAELILNEIFKQTAFAADNFTLTLNDSVPNMRKVIEAYKEENAVLSPLNKVAASMYKWWLSLVLSWERGFNVFNRFINGMSKAGQQLNKISNLNNSRTPEEAKYRARDIITGFSSEQLEALTTYNDKLSKRANLSIKASDADDTVSTEKAKGWWNSITSKSKREADNISKESKKAIQSLSKDIAEIDDTRSNIQSIANQIISGGLIMADFMAELNNNKKLSNAAKKAVENEINLLIKANKTEEVESRALTAEQKRERYLNKIKSRSQIVTTANTDAQNGSINPQTYANRIAINSSEAMSLNSAEDEFKRYRGKIIKGGSLTLSEQEEYDILAPMFQSIIEQAKQSKISAGAYIDKLSESVGKDNKELVGDMFLLTDNLEFITSELNTAQLQYQAIQAKFDSAKTTKQKDIELINLSEQQKSIDLIEQQKNILLEKMDAISYAMEIALGQTLLTGVNNTLSAIETGIADITGILETGNLSPDKIIKMFSDFSKALLTGIEDIDKAMKTAQQRKNLKALGNAGENVTKGVGDTLKESGKGLSNASAAIPIAGAVLGGISAIASIISSLVMQFDGNSFRKELKELNDKTEKQLSVMKDQLNILRSQQQYMDLQYRQQSIGRNVNTQEKLQRALEKLENSKKQTELVNNQYGSVKESDYIKAGADTSMLESVKLKYGNKKNFAWSDYDGIRNEMVSEYQRRGLTDTANMLKGKNLKTYSKGRDEFIKEIEEHAAREAETSKIKIDALENQLSIEEEIATLTEELNKSNASNLKNAKAITEELKKQLDLYKQIMGTQEQLAQIGLRDILNRTTTNEKPLSNKSYQFNSKEK